MTPGAYTIPDGINDPYFLQWLPFTRGGSVSSLQRIGSGQTVMWLVFIQEDMYYRNVRYHPSQSLPGISRDGGPYNKGGELTPDLDHRMSISYLIPFWLPYSEPLIQYFLTLETERLAEAERIKATLGVSVIGYS